VLRGLIILVVGALFLIGGTASAKTVRCESSRIGGTGVGSIAGSDESAAGVSCTTVHRLLGEAWVWRWGVLMWGDVPRTTAGRSSPSGWRCRELREYFSTGNPYRQDGGTLTGSVTRCASGGELFQVTAGRATRWSVALASPYVELMSSAGKMICDDLPPAAHPETCTVLQDDIKSCRASAVPILFQLSQAVYATAEAAKFAKHRQQKDYAAPTLSQLETYEYDGSVSDGLLPSPGDDYHTRFYDDAAWTGVALLTLYQQTGQKWYLDAANQEWQFERTGQRRGADGSDAGIWWNTRHPFVSAEATGGAIRLALELYEIQPSDWGKLAFAEENYAWASQHLENANDLYVDTDPATDTTTTPDNQAWFIDDGRLLYQVTGQGSYLTEATSTANAAVAQFGSATYNYFSASQFAALYASLLRLDGSNGTYVDALDAYVSNWIAPNTMDGHFRYPGARSGCSTETLQQAGASRAFTLRALG
jgi:hypothetical protein